MTGFGDIDVDEVIRRAINEDPEIARKAFEVIHDALREVVVKVIVRRFPKQANDSEDCFQSVLLKLWSRRNELDIPRSESRVTGWFIRVAVNEMTERLRRRCSKEAVMTDISGDKFVESVEELGEPDIAEQVAEAEEINLRESRLQDAIKNLTPVEQDVVRLALVGKSRYEIAEQLGLPYSTVCEKLKSAVKKLQNNLGQRD